MNHKKDNVKKKKLFPSFSEHLINTHSHWIQFLFICLFLVVFHHRLADNCCSMVNQYEGEETTSQRQQWGLAAALA